MEDYHIEKIKKLIKLEYGYDVDSPTRKREIVETRAMYYTILKEFTNLTLSGIARTVGKNHATILHGLNNFKNWRKQNKYLNYAYKSIVEKLNNLDDYQEYNTLDDIRKELVRLKLENFDLRNKEQDKDSIEYMIQHLPKEKIQEIKDRIGIMIKSYEWKSNDKIKVYQANATQVL